MKEKYKHLLNFIANVITLAMEAVLFGWTWYVMYVPMLDKANKLWNRGNWAVIGMYVLFVFFLKFSYSVTLNATLSPPIKENARTQTLHNSFSQAEALQHFP